MVEKIKRCITDRGLAAIKRFEGFVDHVYLCAAQVPTIGYGHALRVGEEFPSAISEEQAEALLAQDVGWAEDAVVRLISVPLSDGQFDALVSFTFNLGSGALQRSTLRSCLNRGEYQAAADELPKWCMAGGRKLDGLLKRRLAERAMFIGG
jgi:lysozyme